MRIAKKVGGWLTAVALAAMFWSTSPAAVAQYPQGDEPQGTGTAVAYYLPNRLADFLDILSLHVGFGIGLHANAHATRALQLGAGATNVSRLGLDRREIGNFQDRRGEISILPFSAFSMSRQNNVGNFDEFDTADDMPVFYSEYQDYAAVGAEVTAAIVSVGADVHPLEIPDAIFGLVGLDMLGDDMPYAPDGRKILDLTPADAQRIQKVVIVPSRVVADSSVRMGREEGIGVYYHRYPNDKFFGLLGSLMAGSEDRLKRDELDGLLERQGYDIERQLMERAEYTLSVDNRLAVVDVAQSLADAKAQSKNHSYKDQTVRRLDDYMAYATQQGADAVLDIRIWEWGVKRGTVQGRARVSLDCQYRLISVPDGRVMFNRRIGSLRDEKQEIPLDQFTQGNGETLVQENNQACDVVHAVFADVLNESR